MSSNFIRPNNLLAIKLNNTNNPNKTVLQKRSINDDEDEINISNNKKSKVDLINIESSNDCNKLLTLLYDYINSNLVKQHAELNINNILLENVPYINVIGLQSAGKSSILNKITNRDLPIGNGLVTKCPIELRCSKKYTTSKIYLSNNNIVYPTITDANNAFNGNSISDSIIYEIPHTREFIIVDLPGINNITHENYYKDIFNKYSKNKQSSYFIHVTNGSTDFNVDFSNKFIDELNLPIKMVCITHMDNAIHFKVNYPVDIYNYYKNKNNGTKICLSNKLDNMKQLTEYSNNNNMDVIYVNNIIKDISSFLENVLKENKIPILTHLEDANRKINNHLGLIGYEKSYGYINKERYRTNYINNIINDYKKQQGILASDRKKCYNVFNVNVLEKYINECLPNKSLMITNMKNTMRSLPFTSGTKEYVDESINRFVELIKTKITINVVENLSSIIKQFLLARIASTNNSISNNLSDKIYSKIAFYLENVLTTYIDDIKKKTVVNINNNLEYVKNIDNSNSQQNNGKYFVDAIKSINTKIYEKKDNTENFRCFIDSKTIKPILENYLDVEELYATITISIIKDYLAYTTIHKIHDVYYNILENMFDDVCKYLETVTTDSDPVLYEEDKDTTDMRINCKETIVKINEIVNVYKNI